MIDQVGMILAVDILLKSLIARGKLVEHVQFATLRKLRATYTKNWESSPAGVKEGAAFANGKYRVSAIGMVPQFPARAGNPDGMPIGPQSRAPHWSSPLSTGSDQARHGGGGDDRFEPRCQ